MRRQHSCLGQHRAVQRGCARSRHCKPGRESNAEPAGPVCASYCVGCAERSTGMSAEVLSQMLSYGPCLRWGKTAGYGCPKTTCARKHWDVRPCMSGSCWVCQAGMSGTRTETAELRLRGSAPLGLSGWGFSLQVNVQALQSALGCVCPVSLRRPWVRIRQQPSTKLLDILWNRALAVGWCTVM